MKSVATIGGAVALVAVAAVLASPSPTSAQERTDCTMADFERCLPPYVSPDALADLIAAARAAIDVGDWMTALDTLDEAVAIVPLGVTQVARANALWQLGRTDEALALCVEMLEDVDPVAVERAGALRALIEASMERPSAAESPAPVESSPAPIDEPTESDANAPLSAAGQDSVVPQADSAEPVARGRSNEHVVQALVWTTSSLTVGFGIAGVVIGAHSDRLEDDVRNYDRSAPDASIEELNALERDASRTSSRANVCYVVAAAAGGTAVGLALAEWLDGDGRGLQIGVAPARGGAFVGLRFER